MEQTGEKLELNFPTVSLRFRYLRLHFFIHEDYLKKL